nr:hypothetical protein [uncultured Mediterraneibacter sp.]
MEESIKAGIPLRVLSGRNDKKAGEMSESARNVGRMSEMRKNVSVVALKNKNVKNIGAELLNFIRINKNKLCKITNKTPKNKRN